MKTYKVPTATRELTLLGMTDGVKEDVTDIVRAREIRTNTRLMKKGLLTAEEFLSEKQSILGLTFASEPVVRFLASVEGKTALAKAMCEEATDAEVAELAGCMSDSETPAGAVFEMIFEEAYPKKKTVKTTSQPSTVPESPTSGEPSSATIHSGSTQP